METGLDPLEENPKYQRIRKLDDGAFGAVYHAKNMQTGEEVAIKLIPLGERFFPKYVQREISNHRQLAHPHIVAFKEVFVTQQYLGIVMEFVGGGNLQQWVERHGRLPEWQARCFFQQITLALHYSHTALRIAHRDIKLGNILLNDRYQVPILKVCDFGYSKNTAAGSVPKTRVGTAAYISPEVARGSGQAYDTEKADVWSMGVTLYCMVAGRYPFTDASDRVTLQRVQGLEDEDVARALGALRGVSPECRALLARLLAVDPARRVTLEGIMQDGWFRQFLPDLSKLAAAPPQEVQPEGEMLAALAAAEGLAAAARRRRNSSADEALNDVDEALEGMESSMVAAFGSSGEGYRMR